MICNPSHPMQRLAGRIADSKLDSRRSVSRLLLESAARGADQVPITALDMGKLRQPPAQPPTIINEGNSRELSREDEAMKRSREAAESANKPET